MTFFREMKARNLVPVPDTYNILMQQGHDVGTIDLLGELMVSRITPQLQSSYCLRFDAWFPEVLQFLF
jgi:phosphoserine aminotransferase